MESPAIKKAKEGWLVKRQDELKDIVGKKILYDMDRKSFSYDQKATDNLEFNGAHQISAAFKILCGIETIKKPFPKKLKKSDLGM